MIRIKMEPESVAVAAATPSPSSTTLPGKLIIPSYCYKSSLAVIRSEEIAPIVGPMRSRLNAINEDKEKVDSVSIFIFDHF